MDHHLLPLAKARKIFTSTFLLTCFTLQGCFNGEGLSPAERVQSAGWAGVEREDIEDEEPLYCYRSLGAVDCYKSPIHGRENQLVAPYPPKPPSYKSFFVRLFEDSPPQNNSGNPTMPVNKIEAASYEASHMSQGWPDSSDVPDQELSNTQTPGPISIK